MSGLPNMLKRAGLLSEQEVSSIQAYCDEHDLAPMVALFELELLDEDRLVSFLKNKLMIPMADAECLARVGAATLSLVPAELAWTYAVLPVSVDDIGNVTLAMGDPTDAAAIDAIAAHTGAYVVRAMSPIPVLREAIKLHYGPAPTERKGPPTPLEIPAAGKRRTREIAGQPPFSPIAVSWVLPKLLRAADRDELTEILLDFLARGFDRVILFLHLREELKGRDARGSDLVLDAVTQVRIPTSGPSVFADVIRSAEPAYGPWPTERPIDRAFAQAMGGIEEAVLVMPIRLRDKIPIVVFACGPRDEVKPLMIRQLADAMGGSLERMIFQQKSRAALPR